MIAQAQAEAEQIRELGARRGLRGGPPRTATSAGRPRSAPPRPRWGRPRTASRRCAIEIAEAIEADAIEFALALAGKILAGAFHARPELVVEVVQGALRRINRAPAHHRARQPRRSRAGEGGDRADHRAGQRRRAVRAHLRRARGRGQRDRAHGRGRGRRERADAAGARARGAQRRARGREPRHERARTRREPHRRGAGQTRPARCCAGPRRRSAKPTSPAATASSAT